MTEISVNDAVNETLAIVQHEYESNDIRITANLTENLTGHCRELELLTASISELLINACDAMPEGGDDCNFH